MVFCQCSVAGDEPKDLGMLVTLVAELAWVKFHGRVFSCSTYATPTGSGACSGYLNDSCTVFLGGVLSSAREGFQLELLLDS